jgi:hypothetical protein
MGKSALTSLKKKENELLPLWMEINVVPLPGPIFTSLNETSIRF